MLNETGKSYGTKGGVATMKTADKSFSSKAMKVLLSIALVIGLAPAISPAKAYATAKDITFSYVDTAGTTQKVTAVDGTASFVEGVYSLTDTADSVLTLYTNVSDLTLEAVDNLTIKAADGKAIVVSSATKSALSGAALTLDGGKSGSLTFETTHTDPTAAVVATGAVTVKGAVITKSAVPATGDVTVSAVGLTVSKDAALTGVVTTSGTTTITGAVTGSVLGTSALTVADTGSVSGDIAGAAVTTAGTVGGKLAGTGVVAVNGGSVAGAVSGTTSVAVGANASTGSVSSDGAVVVNGTVKGDITKATAVTIKSADGVKAAAVTGDIVAATTVDIGQARDVFAQYTTATLGGSILGATDNITLGNTAVVVGTTNIADAKGLAIDRYTTVANVVLGSGSTVSVAAGHKAVPVLSDGETVNVDAANSPYSATNFTVTIDPKLALTYNAKGQKDAIEAAMFVATKAAPTVNVLSTEATVTYADATGAAVTNPTEAGTYTVKVVDNGGKALVGTVLKQVTIAQASFDDAKLQVSAKSQTHTGKAVEPVSYTGDVPGANYNGDLAVQYNAGTATVPDWQNVNPANYTLSYENNIQPSVDGAKVSVAFNGKSLAAGTKSANFSIVADPTKYLGDAVIAVYPGSTIATAVAYTGSAIAPATNTAANSITIGGKDVRTTTALEYYSDPACKNKIAAIVDPGTYYVKVVPAANSDLTGYKVSTFYVAKGLKASEWDITFAPIADQVYTGAAQTPKSDVTLTNKVNPAQKIKIAAADYDVKTATSNTAVGDATITKITINKGPYANAELAGLTGAFKIVPLDLSAANVKVSLLNASDKPFSLAFNNTDQKTLTTPKVMVSVGGAEAFQLTVASNCTVAAVAKEAKNAGSYDYKVTAAVGGQANVKGEQVVKNALTITPYDFSISGKVVFASGAAETVTFNGQAQVPTTATPTTPDFGTLDTDYEWVIYAVDATTHAEAANPAAAVDAGTYHAYIQAKGANFAGKSGNYVTLTINKLSLGDTALASPFSSDLKAAYAWTGQPIVPVPTITITTTAGKTATIPAGDLALTYDKNTDLSAGGPTIKYTVKADSKNFVAASYATQAFKIVNSNDLSLATLTLDQNTYAFGYDPAKTTKTAMTYTPKLTVTLGDKVLTAGTDYTVTSADDQNAASAVGSYTIAIEGKAATPYAGTTASTTWSITKGSLASATVAAVENLTYNKEAGHAQTAPTPAVALNGVKLAAGTEAAKDFEYAYFKQNATDGTWLEIAASAIKEVGTYRIFATADVATSPVAHTAKTSLKDTSTASAEFKVVPCDISNASFTLAPDTSVYDGTAGGTIDATATLGGAYKDLLTVSTDYDLVYCTDAAGLNPVKDAEGNFVAPTNAGTYYVKIVGKGNYKGTTDMAAKAFTITPMAVTKDGSFAFGKAGAAPDLNYNGEAKAPAANINITVGSTPTNLVAGTDYLVTYVDDKGATVSPVDAATGKYKAVFTTKAGSNFKFEASAQSKKVEKAFNIVQLTATTDNLVMDPIADQMFTGKDIKPVPTNVGIKVKAADGTDKVIPLSAATDYVVTYNPATPNAVGKYEVKIAINAGLTNFAAVGTAFVTNTSFNILAANDINVATIDPIADQPYTGKEVKPSLKITLNGKTLTEGVDFTTLYENNIEAGKAWITVSPAGAYTGKARLVYFNIVDKLTYNTLAGDTELGTMIKIQEDAFATGSCDTVIVATSGAYYDALAASGLAGALKAKSGKDVPVLITDGSALSYETASTIAYLGAKHIIIAGGELAVSADVEKALKVLAGVTDIKRVAGATEIETAIATNTEAAAAGSVSDTAVLATSAHFADALSAAPYAYAKAAPIYLASADGSMTAETAAALKNFKNVKIVGGTAVVSETTAAALKAQGNNVERWAGDDCYQTSADIATKAVAAGVLSFDTASVATGKTYYDALSASAAAGSKKSVLLLVDEGIAGSFGIDATLAANKAAIHAVNFLGGPLAVTPKTQDAIKAALA
ncbi:MAG: cell wall-binding repeat-containing protein [Raoultibacter sp.]